MWREGVRKADGKISFCNKSLPPPARATPEGVFQRFSLSFLSPKKLKSRLVSKASSMQVIADICKQMGHGMAEFIEADVLSVEDYDRYCHYVAGLVGIGLSQV